jgi:ATP-dependent HslUV protease, peptidase subunit HslV
MSTVTAVRKNGYIAIACDTLVTWGNEKNAAHHVINHDKIMTVGENLIAVTGPAAGYHALKHFFSTQEGDVLLHTPDDIFLYWRDFQKALKEEYFFEAKSEEAGFEPNTLDILLINPYGIFAVGAYRDIQQFSTYYAYGSGNEYALGAIYTQFDNPDWDAKKLAELGIKAAAEFNNSTSLPLISHVIKEAQHA